MKRGRPRLELTMPAEQKEELESIFRRTKDARVKERCQALLMAEEGGHTYEQIAKRLCRSRAIIQIWVKNFIEDGFESLESRQGRNGGRPTEMRREDLLEELREGLKDGRWKQASEVMDWLRREHGLKRSYTSIYYWLGKAGGALKVPRPVHVKKDAEEAESFKEHFYDKLEGLGIEGGKRVRVWVQDEARYGLHSVTRRCWGLRGHRVVKPAQQKYEWGYIYGALDVVEGGGEFCYMPSVNLDLVAIFLNQIADSDPDAEHVVIWDNAGFHYRPGDPRLPERVHLLPLPAYSPELNPVEKVWDMVKDGIANRVYPALDEIEKRITEKLRPFWESPGPALRIVGEGWLQLQANALFKIFYTNKY